MLIRQPRKTLLASSAVGPITLQLGSTAVVAQENALMLEEVVISAQKREQTLEDIPGSVAAFEYSAVLFGSYGVIGILQLRGRNATAPGNFRRIEPEAG